MRRFFGMLCLVLIGGAIGCTTSSDVSQYEAALRQATTCEEVLEAIQEDAIAKIDEDVHLTEDSNPSTRQFDSGPSQPLGRLRPWREPS